MQHLGAEGGTENYDGQNVRNEDERHVTLQICPLKHFPPFFLKYESNKRPNPVREPRGVAVPDAFQATVHSTSSPISPIVPLFRSQGTHPVTGQSLPSLCSSPDRVPLRKDAPNKAEAASHTSFSFQVVNNNYHISTD